jgi:hypothetical protein
MHVIRGMVMIFMLALLACTERVEPPRAQIPAPVAKPGPVAKPAAPIRTDRTSYVLTNGVRGPEATIVATLRAPANQALYILNCNGASGLTLQRPVGEGWEYAWIIAMNACMSPPIVVPPGGEHTAPIYVHDNSGGVVGPARRLETGTYRVVWTGVLTSFDANKPGFGPELPIEQRVSAPITITVPPTTTR